MKKSFFFLVLMLGQILFHSCRKKGPEAFFTVENNNCFAPCNVKFRDQSENATSREWKFGDNSPIERNITEPSHLYNTTGEYTVTLTVKNAQGSDAHSEVVKILSPVPAPIADFDFTNGGCSAPCTVPFANKSQNAKTYEWDFGDGSPKSVEINPSHEYKVDGTYSVTLKSTGDAASNSISKEVTIKKMTAPIAAFEVSKSDCTAACTVFFTNNSLNATQFTWDFDNGVVSYQRDPGSVTYTTPRTYTIRLTASSGGQSSTITKIVHVGQSTPTKVYFEKVVISNIPNFWGWDFFEDATGPDLVYKLWQSDGFDWEMLLCGSVVYDPINANGSYEWSCNIPECQLLDWYSTHVISVYDNDGNATAPVITESKPFVLNNFINKSQVNLSNNGMNIVLYLRWE